MKKCGKCCKKQGGSHSYYVKEIISLKDEPKKEVINQLLDYSGIGDIIYNEEKRELHVLFDDRIISPRGIVELIESRL